MRSPRIVAAFLVALLVACSGGSKRPTTKPDDPGGKVGDVAAEPALPLWDRVKKGTLPNGLTYYVLPHAKPANRVYLWLAVNAGSVQEDDDQRGLAHFVEHMAFNGTERFEKHEIVDYLQKIGVDFGADLNAYTSFDQTVYQLQVPTDDPTFVGKGLDILRDWAGGISFDPEEVEKERGVVLEEWRLGRGAWARLFDEQAPVLFAGSRYADRLVIGLPDTLKTAPRDTLVRYYKDWYRPDLMAVIVVGDIDPATLEQEITSRFADLKGPEQPRERPRAEVPRADGTRISIETDKEMPQTSINIYNTFAHRPEASKSDYRRLIRDGLYHLMLNERFETLRQQPDAPFLFAGSSTSDVVREVEGFSRFAAVKDGRVDEALEVLLAEVIRVERHGFTAPELERAAKQWLRGIQQAALEIDKRDGRELADEITRNYFEGELMIGRAAEAALAEELIPTITLEELNTLAREWGGDENRVIMIAGPEGLKATEAKVKEVVAAVGKRELEPWRDEVAGKELIARKPAPGTISAERTLDKVGVVEWTLSNGIKVVVKPTDFENDTFMMQGFSAGGTATASDADFPSARFASEVVGAGGAGEHSDAMLDKLLAGKVVNVYPWIGEVEEGINATGSAQDVEAIFQLVYLTMQQPRKDAQAFAVWKQQTLEWVANRRVDPGNAFWEDMGAVLSKDHPRRKPPEVADVEKVELDKALAFYQDRFGDAGDFTFVIVGNVDPEKLRPLVETYLGGLATAGRKEKEKDLGIKRPKGKTIKTIAKGIEPKAQVYLTFHGDQKWTRDDERDLGIFVEVLNLRLFEVLREDMGGVYGVGVWGGITRKPKQERTLTVQFGCAPENVDKLKKAVFDEIAALQKSGIGDDYLEKVRKGRVRQREVALRENWAWSGWLSQAYRHGDDLDVVLDLEADLARVSSARIKASAKKFADGKQYVLGVLTPEAAAKK
jgi:zinc protease